MHAGANVAGGAGELATYSLQELTAWFAHGAVGEPLGRGLPATYKAHPCTQFAAIEQAPRLAVSRTCCARGAPLRGCATAKAVAASVSASVSASRPFTCRS